ncbi:hypothetical protein LWI29_024694 [Acer saccharum]|uniref:Uncharacterized protein n=1 Tax=Acer saccharum TaxID=4024 RepID=A0AA39SIP3_ACESA|nr:hypothetical protein LWI29_024694 [Acer saccharum]
MQTSSDVEEVELVLYKEPTSFWRSGIISWKDAFKFFTNTSDEYYHQLRSVYFLEKELQQPQELPYRHQYLTLWNCVCLAKLPQALHNLSFLTKLCIAECPKLVCFPEAALPSHLRSIEVLSCNALKSLPRTCMGSTSLENLSIEYCKSLMYIARNRLPSNLKRLGIGGCDNLRGSMQEENNNLPATLEVIGIHNCLKLESIAERFENHTALKTINISDCESLKSLPTGGDLPYMNLTSLHIRNYDGNLYDFINLQKLRSLITKKRTSTPLPSPSTKVSETTSLHSLTEDKHFL